MTDREIPEDVFRSEFGGQHLQQAMYARRGRRASGLAIGGLIVILLGPVVLLGAGVVIATLVHCEWGMRC